MAKSVAREAFNYLIDDLRATHGDNLASVLLYGSAAAGDHAGDDSDYNLLIALKRIAPEDLRLAQAPTREWQRLGHPLPVYFTVEELHDAADVFPIEFHQMRRARVVLHGEDPFSSLEISDENLRHQTEYELRSKLIQLRRLYIPASVSVEKLCALMGDSLTSFATLFAPVLMLKGDREPPVLKREIVRATATRLGIDGAPFERIFTIKEAGTQPASEREAHELFASYLDEIQKVIEAVDAMQAGSSGGA